MKDEEDKVEHEEKEKKPEVDVEMIDTVNPQSKPPGQKTIDEFTVIKCTPTPYIVCEYQDSDIINFIEGQEGTTLTTSTVKCRYVTSRPTGITNLSISEEYLNKYTPKRTAASVSQPQSAPTSSTNTN